MPKCRIIIRDRMGQIFYGLEEELSEEERKEVTKFAEGLGAMTYISMQLDSSHPLQQWIPPNKRWEAYFPIKHIIMMAIEDDKQEEK